MIQRNAFSFLEEWKEKKARKPLLVRGARQVGKTSLIRAFGNKYKCFVELNLERKIHYDLFEIDEISKILDVAYLLTNKQPVENSTLFFIDEIQEHPNAIKLLRYFYEEYPDIHVIAAGSLLEFALKEVPSFPVGRIEYLYLHPLNFQEFLVAIDHKQALQAFSEVPIPSFAHSVLIDLFNLYATIGGMPELVSNYIEHKNISKLNRAYKTIWQTYKDDVEKYGKNSTIQNVIRHVISTAPFEQDRIKFANFGGSNYRSREVGEALKSLDLAKIIRLVYPTTATELPVLPDLKKSPRLQFLDTGLLNQVLQLQSEMVSLTDLSSVYRGRIIQHLIVQELISINDFSSDIPYFWVRESKNANSEVDIVYPFKNLLIPIEVKSGKAGTLRSLHEYMDRSNHDYAVRVYAGLFKIEELVTRKGKPYLLMNLPYYLGTKIPHYLNYFIDNYSIEN